MKKIFLFGLIFSVLISFISCDKDAEGPLFDDSLEDTNILTFQVEEGDFSIAPDGNGEINIPVFRLNPSGSYSSDVEIEISDESVFSVESSTVSFNEDETETHIVVKYDYDVMEFFKDYTISITIPGDAETYLKEEYVLEGDSVTNTQSLIKSTLLNIDKALTWSPYGEVYWVSEFWEEEGVRQIWKSDQADAYRVENIFFIDNGPTFEFLVDEEGNISAAEFQEVWYNETYSAWVGAMDVTGYKEGNTFYISVGWYYMLEIGGWQGPWAETGTLIEE